MSRIETIGDATLYLGDCRNILHDIGVEIKRQIAQLFSTTEGVLA